MQLTKYVTSLVTLALLVLPAYSATTLTDGIFAATDTTGTNATPRRITISAQTNLLAGTLTTTNNLTVGNNAAVGGTLSITGAITNAALQSATLVYASAAKVLGSVSSGSNGVPLTASGPGVAPVFNDYPVFLPNVVDGASAVAYHFDTTNPLTTSGAKLATFGNRGTNAVTVTSLGNLWLGRNSWDWWGGPDDTVGIINIHVFGAGGDQEANEFQFGSSAADGTVQSVFSISTDELDTDVTISSRNDGLGRNNYVNIRADTSDPELTGIVVGNNDDGNLLSLKPFVADGTTPSIFDTSLAHTSGNLAEFKNNGTNAFQLTYDQQLKIIDIDNTGNLNPSLYIANNDETVSTFTDERSYGVYMGRTILNLAPDTPDNNTPYLFDSFVTHTTGNIAEFKNNTTNVLQILAADVAATNAPIILLINGVQKQVHVGAPDSGGTGLRALTILN